MARQTLIGVDVGTTTIKALLIDQDGNRLDGFSRPYAMAHPQPGFAQQDPGDWMDGVLAALTQFAAHHDLSGLLGIGVTSQVNTHVFVDAEGTPLLPAIVWQDNRCAPDAKILDASVTDQQKTAWFGGPVPIDASHALSRMAYVARVHPDAYRATRHVLLPKDFVGLGLTGAVATDAISSVGLVDQKPAYVEELMALVPGALAKLAPLGDITQSVGRVKTGLPCAGTPVITSTMDAWAGMFGLGVIEDGDAMYQSGTSEILGIVSSRTKPTPGVILFPPYQGVTLHAAPTQSGGASLAWLSTLLGRTLPELSELVENTERGANVPLFLPHLQGERAPLWDSATRGVFARLEAASGPGHLARAVMEGVALSARLAFAALEESADRKIDQLNIGGGGAQSDIWCQIRADALGKTLRRVKVADAAALGAAILGGVGSGGMAAVRAKMQPLVQFDRTFEPDPTTRSYFDTRFEHYQALYADLKPFNARF